MNKDFNLNDIIDRMDLADVSIEAATNQVLIEVFKMIQSEAARAIAKHRDTGTTARSLLQTATVEVSADRYSIDLGFDIENHGYPTIFLMFGTPRIKPNRELWAVFFGAAIKKKVDDLIVTKVYDELFKYI